MQVAYKNFAISTNISRYISQAIQDAAIITIGDKYRTAPELSNGTSFNDFE